VPPVPGADARGPRNRGRRGPHAQLPGDRAGEARARPARDDEAGRTRRAVAAAARHRSVRCDAHVLRLRPRRLGIRAPVGLVSAEPEDRPRRRLQARSVTDVESWVARDRTGMKAVDQVALRVVEALAPLPQHVREQVLREVESRRFTFPSLSSNFTVKGKPVIPWVRADGKVVTAVDQVASTEDKKDAIAQLDRYVAAKKE